LEALDEMRKFRNVIKEINGLMITICHNTFLGTEKRFIGWKEAYEKFLTQAK
jgi:hypothetical protein